MAQEAIEFDSYYRCYVLGRKRVRIMMYNPKNPHHLRYVADYKTPPELEVRMHRDAIALCEGLGYDMNTVEFAIRDGIPYAIDFMNCAPDADRMPQQKLRVQAWTLGSGFAQTRGRVVQELPHRGHDQSRIVTDTSSTATKFRELRSRTVSST